MLIHGLLASGNPVRYHGDFDWPESRSQVASSPLAPQAGACPPPTTSTRSPASTPTMQPRSREGCADVMGSGTGLSDARTWLAVNEESVLPDLLADLKLMAM